MSALPPLDRVPSGDVIPVLGTVMPVPAEVRPVMGDVIPVLAGVIPMLGDLMPPLEELKPVLILSLRPLVIASCEVKRILNVWLGTAPLGLPAAIRSRGR